MPIHERPAVIAIFLKNKIGGLDSILPLLLEAKGRNPSLVFEFHTFDRATYRTICINPVLSDCLNSLGYLRDQTEGGWILRKLRRVWLLARLSTLGLLGRSRAVHFSLLENWPWRVLYYCCKDCFHIRDGAFGSPPDLWRQQNLQMRFLPAPNHHWVKPPKAGVQIYFNADSVGQWPVTDSPVVVMDPPRLRAHWLRLARSRADTYLGSELADMGFPRSSEIIAYMVRDFGENTSHVHQGLRSADSLLRLFDLTLDVLVEEGGGRPIVIRTQFYSEYAMVLEKLRDRPGAPVLLTHVHPSVLATQARIFVTNWATTALADARFIGVPTIEFSDYCDEYLMEFGGNSYSQEWTEYFINRDVDQFRKTVRNLLQPAPERPTFAGILGDSSGIIDQITFGTQAKDTAPS